MEKIKLPNILTGYVSLILMFLLTLLPLQAQNVEELVESGQELLELDEPEEAAKTLSKAFSLKPTDSQIGKLLAEAYEAASDWNNALKIYDILLKKEPNSYSFISGKLRSLENAGISQGQAPLLLSLFEQNPSDLVVGTRLAALLTKTGSPSEIARAQTIAANKSEVPEGVKSLLTQLNSTGTSSPAEQAQVASPTNEVKTVEVNKASTSAPTTPPIQTTTTLTDENNKREDAARAQKLEEQRRLSQELAQKMAKQKQDSLETVNRERDRLYQEAQAREGARRDSLNRVLAEKDAIRRDSLAKQMELANLRESARRDSMAKVIELQRLRENSRRDSIAQALELSRQKEQVRRDSLAQVFKAREDSMALVRQKREDSLETARLEREKQYRETQIREAARRDSLTKAMQVREAARRDSLSRALEAARLREIARRDSLMQVQKAREDSLALVRQKREDSLTAVRLERERLAKLESEFREKVSAVLRNEISGSNHTELLVDLDEHLKKDPQQQQWLEAKGRLLFYLKDYDAALGAFGKISYKSPAVRQQAAQAAYRTQKFPLVIENLKDLPKYGMEDSLWLSYIDALIQTQNMAGAAAEYEQYALKNPTNMQALNFLLDYYRTTKNTLKLQEKLRTSLNIQPKDALKTLELARLYPDTRPEALEYRKQYLTLEPGDSRVERELADIYIKRGQTQEAVQILNKLAPQFATDPQYTLQLAGLLKNLGRNEEAANYYQKAYDLNPSQKELLPLIASLYKNSGSISKALAALKQSIEAQPNQIALQVEMLTLVNEKTKGSQKLQELEWLAQINPKGNQINASLLNAQLENSRFPEAYITWQKQLTLSPDHPSHKDWILAVLKTEDQIKAHRGVLEKLSAVPGADLKLKILAYQSQAQNGAFKAAAASVRQIRLLQPAYGNNDENIIGHVYKGEDYTLCAEMAENFLLQNPSNTNLIDLRFKSYEKMGASGPKRMVALRSYLKAFPETQGYWLEVAKSDLAQIDTSAALKNLKVAVARTPQSTESWKLLSSLTAQRSSEKIDRLEALNNLVNLDPANASAYHRDLALMYYKDKDYTSALPHFKNSTKTALSDASYWYAYGETENNTGNNTSAKEKFARAYQLESGNLSYARKYAQLLTTDAEIQSNIPLFTLLSKQPGAESEKIKLASALSATGKTVEALPLWRELLQKDPELSSKYPLVLGVFYANKDYLTSIQIIEKLKRGSTSVGLLDTLAQCYAFLDKKTEYLRTVEEIVRMEPAYKQYQINLAQLYMNAGDSSKAITQYRDYTGRNPKNFQALATLFQLVQARRDTLSMMDALAALTAQPGVNPRYTQTYAELQFLRNGDKRPLEAEVKKDPAYRKGRVLLVQAYTQDRDYKKIIPFESILIEEAQKNPRMRWHLLALYLDAKSYPKAAKTYYELLKSKEGDRNFYSEALSVIRVHLAAQTTEVLEWGVSRYPSDIGLKLDLAQNLGKTEAALILYEDALKQDRQNKITVKNGALLALSLGKNERSIPFLQAWHQLEPNDIEPLTLLAGEYRKKNDTSKLIEALERLSAMSSNRRPIILELSSLYSSQNNLAKAEENLNLLLSYNPKDSEIQTRLVTLVKKGGNKEKLKQTYQAIAEQDTSSYEIQAALAELYLAEGNKGQAYFYTRKAMRNRKGNYEDLLIKSLHTDEHINIHRDLLQTRVQNGSAGPDIALKLAKSYQLSGQNQFAAREYTRVYNANKNLLVGNKEAIQSLYTQKQFSESAELSENYLKNQPSDREISAILVSSYTALNATPQLQRSAMRRLLYLDPSLQNYWFPLAKLELASADTTQALKWGRQVLESKPNNLEVLKFLAPLLPNKPAEKQLYTQVLTQLIELEPAQAPPRRRALGRLRLQEGDESGALSLFKASLNAYPNDAELWYTVAGLEEKNGQLKDAEIAYAKAYSLAPTKVAVARSYGKYIKSEKDLKQNTPLFELLMQSGASVEEKSKLAQSYVLNGRDVDAKALYDQLAKTDKTLLFKDPHAGRVYLKLGNFKEAEAIYTSRRSERNLGVLDTLALIYQSTNQGTLRKNLLEEIVQLDPTYKNYELELASLRIASKDTSGALSLYRSYTARNPKDRTALEAVYNLSAAKKDTLSQIEVLESLVKFPNPSFAHQSKLAELQFVRVGDISLLSKLVLAQPSYTQGKVYLISHYYQAGKLDRLMQFEAFMAQNAQNFPLCWAPLASVQVKLGKNSEANLSYFQAYQRDLKNEELFNNALSHSRTYKSPHLTQLLALGYSSFPDREDLALLHAEAMGQTPAALAVLQKILQTNSYNIQALKLAAEAARSLGKKEEHKTYLNRWSQSEPGSAEVWKKQAAFYAGEKDTTNALKAWENWYNLENSNHALAYKISKVYRKKGQLTRALDYLQLAAQSAPTQLSYQKELGVALLSQNRPTEALEPLKKAIPPTGYDEVVAWGLYKAYTAMQDDAGALVQLEKIVQNEPRNVKAIYPLASAKARASKYPDVIKLLGNSAIIDQLPPEQALLLLEAYLQTQQKPLAVSYGDQLLSKYPEKAKKSAALGLLFYESQRYSEAKTILSEVIRNSANPQASFTLGRIAFDNKEWESAIANFEAAKPYSPEISRFQGIAYSRMGKNKEAITALESYYLETRKNEVLPLLVDIYRAKQDTIGLFDALGRQIKANPNLEDARAEYAYICTKMGDLSQAEAQYSIILRKNPLHPKANYFMGLQNESNRKYQLAAKQLSIGLKSNSSFEGWLALGRTQVALGQNNAALDAYKQALKIDSSKLEPLLARANLLGKIKAQSELRGAYQAVLKLDSNQTSMALALAQIEYGLKNYKASAALYGRALTQTGGDRISWENYGLSLLELGRTREAKNALERAVQMGSSGVDLMIMLARIHIKDKEVSKAQLLLQDVLAKKPNFHQAHFYLAELSLQKNQVGVAEDHLVQALKFDPTNADYATALAKIYAQSERSDEIIKLLTPFGTRLSPEGKELMVTALVQKKNLADAKIILLELVKQKSSLNTDLLLGNILLGEKRARQAVEHLELSKYRSEPQIIFLLAKAYSQAGSSDQALTLLESALKENKDNAEYYLERAKLHQAKGNADQAQSDLEKTLRLNPNLPEAVELLGLNYLNRGKPERAMEYFKEMSSSEDQLAKRKGYVGQAAVFERQGKFEAQKYHLEQALVFGETAEILNLLSGAYLNLNDIPNAKKYASKAFKEYPSDDLSYVSVVNVFMFAKQKEKAMAFIKENMEKFPNSCPIRIAYASVNWEFGYQNPVAASAKFVQTQCPENPWSHYYLGLLAHKFQSPKEGKKFFKEFIRLGGDPNKVPKD